MAEERDPKGLYAKARSGEISGFTGIDAPYEAPESPEVHIDAGETDAETAARMVVEKLREMGFIGN